MRGMRRIVQSRLSNSMIPWDLGDGGEIEIWLLVKRSKALKVVMDM